MSKFYLLPILLLFCITSCQNKNGETETIAAKEQIPDMDTAVVLAAFEELKNDSAFIKNCVEFQNGVSHISFYNGERPLPIGDINQDGETDALIPFEVAYVSNYSRYSKLYYAILLNQNGKLNWIGNYDRENFPSSYYYPNQVLSIEKIEKESISGYISETSFSPKTPVILEYHPDEITFHELKTYNYYWHYDDLKWNGKLPLHAPKKEILGLFGQPDNITDFFSDCNYNNGPKKVYHYGNLELVFNEKEILENESYRVDNDLKVSIQYQNIKLDHNTTYEDIRKLSPEILQQQPIFPEDEEKATDRSYKTIYIPLHQKITDNNYFDSNWVILYFKQNHLEKIVIPEGDCGI